ncbi:MAG: methionyl-tRNA formyltransferase [Lentisphaeria bacterium]|nr:methionyl-tRNA formyltransferase [Lentisphaeria bacterium]
MPEKLKIYFAGSGRIALPVLTALSQASGIELVGVGTQPDRPVGRKRLLSPTPVGELAAGLGCVLHKLPDINAPEALAAIRACAPRMIVVLSFGQLLKQPVLELPELGCVNIHGSLLPRWRGASPVQQVLLHREKETGVCFMRMERGLDSGPVFRTLAMPIPENCGADALEMALGRLAAQAAEETLLDIASGKLQARPQPTEGVTVCRKITRADGAVRWEFPAERIEAMSRAFENWPGAFFDVKCGGAVCRVTIGRAAVRNDLSGTPGSRLAPDDRKRLIVACGEGALELLEVTPAGRKPMPVAAFLNGFRGAELEFLPGSLPENKTL